MLFLGCVVLGIVFQKSTKVWRHKNEISEIIGFVRIFWENNVQEAYLPKMSISGQIVSEIVVQLNSIQTLLNFFGSTQKRLEGFVWSFLSISGSRFAGTAEGY